MFAKPVAILGLLCSGCLLVQLLPEATNNMNLWLLRVAVTVLTWIVTFIAVMALAVDAKLGPVALHFAWGAACMVVALEVVSSALPIRIAIGLAPFLVNLAVLLPSQPLLLTALGCQLLSAGALLLYAPAAHMNVELARDAEREARHAEEAKTYFDALGKALDAVNADTPLEVLTGNFEIGFDSVRDKVAAVAIAKKPNLEAEMIAALARDSNTRRGVYNLILSPAIPRTPALADAVRDSILLSAAEITPTTSDDQKDSAAYGAVTVAGALPAYKATLRPAMLQLRAATGAPVKQPDRTTGREELARWLR